MEHTSLLFYTVNYKNDNIPNQLFIHFVFGQKDFCAVIRRERIRDFSLAYNQIYTNAKRSKTFESKSKYTSTRLTKVKTAITIKNSKRLQSDNLLYYYQLINEDQNAHTRCGEHSRTQTLRRRKYSTIFYIIQVSQYNLRQININK